jgi:hypothetical protein
MDEETVLRELEELTGRHRCVGCLALVKREEYLANDFTCRACDEKFGKYPLASTPKGESSAARGDRS